MQPCPIPVSMNQSETGRFPRFARKTLAREATRSHSVRRLLGVQQGRVWVACGHHLETYLCQLHSRHWQASAYEDNIFVRLLIVVSLVPTGESSVQFALRLKNGKIAARGRRTGSRLDVVRTLR